MEKVIRDGKVAVLYSPDYGAGWYSWNSEHKQLLFHPKIVDMVEQGRANEIDEGWVLKEIGISDVYCGGAIRLQIEWLPEGTPFRIDEYDGYESVSTHNDLVLTA